MLLRAIWVMGRNAAGKATLAHALIDGTASLTRCRVDVSGWSRSFVPDRVMGFLNKGDLCCRTCRKILAIEEIAHSRAA